MKGKEESVEGRKRKRGRSRLEVGEIEEGTEG